VTKKLYRQLIKTSPRPSTPPAGYSEILCDSDNSGKLTVLRADGGVNVLDTIEGAAFTVTIGISDWQPLNSMFCYDVLHNMDTQDIIPHAFSVATGKSVGMEDLERLNANILRVWSATNTDSIRIVIFKAGTLAGVDASKLNGIINSALNGIPYENADKSEVFSDLNAAKILKSNKDVNGMYTTIEWSDTNNIVRKRSVLSGGTSPEYTTRTETYYNASAILIYTKVFTQQYDTASEWLGESVVI